MIYKLQRLFSEGSTAENNNNSNNGGRKGHHGKRGKKNSRGRQENQQSTTVTPSSTTTAGQQPPKVEPQKIYTPMENEKKYLSDLEKGVNSKDAKKGYEARRNNFKEAERQKRRVERLEKWDTKKAKFKQAKEKAGLWIKRNKKPLILAGSGLAIGTGAAIVGSRMRKKDEQNDIKEDVRGYSDVED